jgi:hypothetical protein
MLAHSSTQITNYEILNYLKINFSRWNNNIAKDIKVQPMEYYSIKTKSKPTDAQYGQVVEKAYNIGGIEDLPIASIGWNILPSRSTVAQIEKL